MKNLRYILVLCSIVVSLSLSAQQQSAMRINEYLVTNTSDFQDDFGQQNAWIELFNTSYGTVDIGGCYLSNDANNLKKYAIPRGDVLTKIKPRQHTLFWADNQPFRGSFHVNFTLAESDTIYFVSSDGRTVIDKIFVKKDLPENVTFGRTEDGIGSNCGCGEGWQVMERTSPSTNNAGVDQESKSDRMHRVDPYGWIMTITAMGVVFSALIVLAIIFTYIGKFSVSRGQRKATKAAEDKGEAAPVAKAEDYSAEAFAAISMALHMFIEENEAHDEESFTITLQHETRKYSPWSSKIYGLRQTPQLKK